MTDQISTHQILALMRSKLGQGIKLGKVERAIAALVKEGRAPGAQGRERWATADDVDLIEAELRRMRAGWSSRRNVRGDFEAWVSAEGDEWWLVRMPCERAWSTERGAEVQSVPSVVGTWEWPTGRLTGCLIRVDDRYGKPAYKWSEASMLRETEVELLSEQWMTGAKPHVTEPENG